MSKAARKILADCQIALEMLGEEQRPERWHVIWVSTLALIRGVGNVLATVDCRTSHQKEVFEAMYRDWYDNPENAIFRQFIMSGRSMVLHNYDGLGGEDEKPFVFDEAAFDSSIAYRFDQFDMSKHMVQSEYRSGEDARVIVADAIHWWEDQLDFFDSKARDRRIN
jgi:hypothetical protein